MANRTTRIILFTALVAPFAAPAQTNAPALTYVVSNAYVEIRSSQPFWRDGGLDFHTTTNAAPPLDMEVTPMPGWELLTPSELHITDGLAGVWSVRGVLGETGAGGEMCIPMTTSNDTHMVAPSFKLPPISTGAGGSGPSVEGLPPISTGGPHVVTPTSHTARVSFSCAPTDLTNGVHECHTSFFSCPGGKTNEERKGPAREYQTLFDRFTWVWSCAGTTNTQEGLALRAGPLELHAGVHPVSATLTARYSNCGKCVYTETVETNIVVSLLSVTCDPWIGLDRTGDPAAGQARSGEPSTPSDDQKTTARSSLNPDNPNVAKVEWGYAGVCDRTDKRDWEMDVSTTSREKCSGSYLEEKVTVAAGAASASDNFTVMKVDVEINGLDETAEESVGAYLACVTDSGGDAVANVKFTCTPSDLPPDEMVTIRNAGHGRLYLKEGNALCFFTTTNIPACLIHKKTFQLHGYEASGALRDGEITIEHPSSKAIDRAFYTVVEVEMEIYKPKVVDASETMIPKSDKLSVGSVTFVNLDNDDRDGRYDLHGARPDGVVLGGDDELAKLRLKVRPSGLTGGAVRLLAVSGGGTVAAWTGNTKATAYPFGAPIAVPTGFSPNDGWLVKTLWIEGVSPHTSQREAVFRMEYALSGVKATDDAALTVVGVQSLSWKGKGNSLNEDDTLDADPNWPTGLAPTALRVFPGARAENGTVGPARDKVDLEVALSVAPPHPINIYLRSFDVDDPTDAAAPVDDEANEEDNRGSPRAGRFTRESDGVKSLQFLSGTISTTCEFKVTMQPGDNFRVVANGDRDFLLDLENVDSKLDIGESDADRNANKQRVCNRHIALGSPSDCEIRQPLQYASPTLTVWRFLHIEADSMAAPPLSGPESNFVEGNVHGISGNGAVATRVILDRDLRTCFTTNDYSANMGRRAGRGRFENGWIKIGSGTGTPGQTRTSSLYGNGNDFVDKATGIDIPAVVSKAGLPDITGKVIGWDWDSNPKRFTLGDKSASISENYIGGTLNVAGVSSTIANVVVPDQVDVVSIPAIPFVLHDDDDDTILPTSPDLGDLQESDLVTRNRLAPLYIRPCHDGGGDIGNNQQDVPFIRNTSSSDAYRWQSRENNSRHFWVAYFLSAFQGAHRALIEDLDPDAEKGTWASSNNSTLFSGVLIYQEVLRDGHLPQGWEPRVCVHELGHNFGLLDRKISIENDGIMHGATSTFPSPADNYFWHREDAAAIRRTYKPD